MKGSSRTHAIPRWWRRPTHRVIAAIGGEGNAAFGNDDKGCERPPVRNERARNRKARPLVARPSLGEARHDGAQILIAREALEGGLPYGPRLLAPPGDPQHLTQMCGDLRIGQQRIGAL